MPFFFPAADLPRGSVDFDWIGVESVVVVVVVVFDVGIDLWAPVDVVIVVVADWSDFFGKGT